MLSVSVIMYRDPYDDDVFMRLDCGRVRACPFGPDGLESQRPFLPLSNHTLFWFFFPSSQVAFQSTPSPCTKRTTHLVTSLLRYIHLTSHLTSDL